MEDIHAQTLCMLNFWILFVCKSITLYTITKITQIKSKTNYLCEGVEPHLFGELCAIGTHFPGPTTPHTTHFSPTELITINLQMIKILDSFVKSYFSSLKKIPFSCNPLNMNSTYIIQSHVIKLILHHEW
jgi:hypothetical protein